MPTQQPVVSPCKHLYLPSQQLTPRLQAAAVVSEELAGHRHVSVWAWSTWPCLWINNTCLHGRLSVSTVLSHSTAGPLKHTVRAPVQRGVLFGARLSDMAAAQVLLLCHCLVTDSQDCRVYEVILVVADQSGT